MSDGHIDSHTVARRCSVNRPDYAQLTALDWVVLDFTDGLRNFEQMQELVPVGPDELEAAYRHLNTLGFLKWKARTMTFDAGNISTPGARVSRLGQGSSVRAVPDSSVSRAVQAPTFSGYSDEICAEYLPERLFSSFRQYTPKMYDTRLDLPAEMQAFVEFISDHLSDLSPCDLLGIPDGTRDKTVIRQAYMTRTKQFHPDRYFRKDIGQFGPRLSAIFKAISSAYNTLQAQ